MTFAHAIGGPRRARFDSAALALLVAISIVLPLLAGALVRSASSVVSLIVRATPGSEATAEQTVQNLGGHVARRIGIINGFSAVLPDTAVAALAASPGVQSVTRNAGVHLLSTSYSPTSDPSSPYNTSYRTSASDFWKNGYTGKGVDVALIDSGVAPVNGLTASGKVVNGPDLSFESQNSSLQYLDTFGHGTHMAGIIAGRDDAATPGQYVGDSTDFIGMAPDARIVSLKVADSHGNTDVSQMLAAIDWVVQHRNDNGFNIRVLNLSYGTDSTQSYTLDPLAYAAEQAWRAGIVVCVAAGNDGGSSTVGLNDPAIDPYVIAVGSALPAKTNLEGFDTVSTFSSVGDGTRNPDLIASGEHMVSLRVPGSYLDQTYGGTAAVATRFFRGSGTSQATAVVSGAAALLLQQRPSATPDQIKALLTGNAQRLSNIDSQHQGAGELSMSGLVRVSTPNTSQNFTQSSGNGSLEAARGSEHVVSNGVTLTGEKDIFGKAFSAQSMAAAEANGSSWSGGMWNGSTWSGSSWSGSSWSGSSWSGSSWSGSSWSGSSWSGSSWSGSSWSSSSWA